ncbi:O-antigen ligase family protein [Dactylosporangium sp. NPDC048998]|uniref:O-antigen ligase family protein n=1 Tax=Dactylosporangium sp. NPDC048998 TaxID=3363976 RepID=UPI0037103C04
MTIATEEYISADLEPSYVSGKTYVSRRRVTRIDAAALLSVTMFLITVIPARLIVPGMTDVGRPGLVVGLALFVWWVLARFTTTLSMTGPQPMRWALMVFLVSALISYAIGFMRGLTTMESNAADRMMLYLSVFSGILLTASDGVPNWIRMRGVLKVVVACAAVVAAIGLLQYVTKVDYTLYLNIPGLQVKTEALGFEVRGSGIRVASTTTHYIELAAFLAMVLPFAIHFALFAGTPQRRRASAIACFVIAAGVAATVSRTGILALGITLLVLVPVWKWRTRFNVLVMAAGLLAGLGAASGGLVRTIFTLFDNPSDNSSINARTERYPMAFHYIAQRPWFGRGTGTWVPPQYQVMDNQWLITLLSTGFVGAAVIAALHITGITLAGLAFRRATEQADKHLCAALISTQLIALMVAATFDSMSLSYSTYVMTLALMCGLCGTVWRLTHPARTIRTSTTRWFM